MNICKTESAWGIRKIVRYGKILGAPEVQPEGTSHPVCYELGQLLQLDRDTCLLAASLDEQGGPDLCVGNDGFIFRHIRDINDKNRLVLNRGEPNYRLRSGKGMGFQAKYPANGAFVPLGAKLEDGMPHPAAGKGFLISPGLTFTPDKTRIDHDGDVTFDLLQLSWDGNQLEIRHDT
jgi:hypothetical protein